MCERLDQKDISGKKRKKNVFRFFASIKRNLVINVPIVRSLDCIKE